MSILQIYAMEVSDSIASFLKLIASKLKHRQLETKLEEAMRELPCDLISVELKTFSASRKAMFITARNSQTYLHSVYSKEDLQRMRNCMQDKWRSEIAQSCDLLGIKDDEPLWIELDEDAIEYLVSAK